MPYPPRTKSPIYTTSKIELDYPWILYDSEIEIIKSFQLLPTNDICLIPQTCEEAETVLLSILDDDKTEITNSDVEVTIQANKEIQGIEGWTLADDKKSLSKIYTENKYENEELIKML